MHLWKDSFGMLLNSVVTIILMSSTSSIRFFLMTLLSLGKRKNHTELCRVSKEVTLVQWCSSRPGTVLLRPGIVNRSTVMMKNLRVDLPQLTPLLMQWTEQRPQDIFVDVLVDCLSLWQKLAVDDAPDIEKCDKDVFEFGLRLSCFLRSWRIWTLPLKVPALGLRVVLKIHVSSPVMTP